MCLASCLSMKVKLPRFDFFLTVPLLISQFLDKVSGWTTLVVKIYPLVEDAKQLFPFEQNRI